MEPELLEDDKIHVPIKGETTVKAVVPKQSVEIHRESRKSDSMPSTTTAEQDLTSAGQRNINLIWESTQMKIALSVTWTALTVSAILAVFGKFLGSPDVQLAAIVFVFGVANLVTGFYFGRTNHTKTGGVGVHEVGR